MVWIDREHDELECETTPTIVIVSEVGRRLGEHNLIDRVHEDTKLIEQRRQILAVMNWLVVNCAYEASPPPSR